MSGYLLDTDTCVDILRNHRRVVDRLKQTSPADVMISTMTEAELRFGCLRSERPEVNLNLLAQFISLIRVLPFDRKAADEHAYLRQKLAPKPIGAEDLVIASIARAEQLKLITGNTREFERVPGLTVENWRAN